MKDDYIEDKIGNWVKDIFKVAPTSADIRAIKEKLEGDFRGGYGQNYITTTAKLVLNKNSTRKDLLLTAHANNTGTIYLGMDLQVSSDNHFLALAAGDTFSLDDFRGELWAIASTGTQKLNYGEW